MVKHTQTICRQKPANCLSVFDQFVGLLLKGLSKLFHLTQKIHLIPPRWCPCSSYQYKGIYVFGFLRVENLGFYGSFAVIEILIEDLQFSVQDYVAHYGMIAVPPIPLVSGVCESMWVLWCLA